VPVSDVGQRGEDAAARLLVDRGYEILHRNWRCRLGEFDIIALDGSTLVICEVKTRRSAFAGTAAEAVGPEKRRRLIRLATAYILATRSSDVSIRFDVIAIDVADRRARIRHLRDAFRGEGYA
jgi:putative endonuclease